MREHDDSGYIPPEEITAESVGSQTVFAVARRGIDVDALENFDLYSSPIMDFPDFQMVWTTRAAAEDFLKSYRVDPLLIAFQDASPVVVELTLPQLRRYLKLNPPFSPGVVVMDRHYPTR